MDLTAALRKWSGGGSSPPSIPYFAEYSLSDTSDLPSSVDIKHYPGLLSYVLIRPKQGTLRVVTYWSTRDHFLRDGERFGKEIYATATSVEGFISGFTINPESFWKRMPWYTFVLGIAAFFGALQAIGNHYDWIFSAPSLALKSEKARIQIVEGTEFHEVASLISHAPVAQREIVLSALLISKIVPEVPLRVEPDQMTHIPAGESQEITINGKAPAAGDYEFAVSAKARAGLLRFAKTFEFRRPVTVWPKLPTGKLSVRSVQGEMGLLSGSIAVGPVAPNGLDCELEIKGIPGLKYDGVFDFPLLHEAARWRTNESPGKEIASLRWAVLPVHGREEIRFQVALFHASKIDWNKVSQGSTLRCYYRKEKFRNASPS
jgi:hypothetical protein